MEVKYTIFKMVDKTVHVPSTDYYASRGDSQEDDVNMMEKFDVFNTLEEAVSRLQDLQNHLKDDFYFKYTIGEYFILPTYTIK